jgi:hypothetical protein|tara:strand:- start:233 stop:496 length:264 start_codon:yes stop_codon:yes gene_type:complete
VIIQGAELNHRHEDFQFLDGKTGIDSIAQIHKISNSPINNPLFYKYFVSQQVTENISDRIKDAYGIANTGFCKDDLEELKERGSLIS